MALPMPDAPLPVSVPRRPKRWVLVLGFFAALFVFVAGGGVAWGWWALMTPLAALDERPVAFTVARGEGMAEVAQHLADAGLVRSSALTALYGRWTGVGTRLQAGAYALRRDESVAELLGRIADGDTVPDDLAFTLPEGLTVREMDTVLADAKVLARGALYAVAKNDEGFLFPDTYRVKPGTSATGVRALLRATFEKRFSQELLMEGREVLRGTGLAAEAASDEKATRAIVTMASIIEREVRTQKDMALVSGVLWRRLALGMPLQVDASVAYGLGKPGTELTRDDLKIPNAYNTYLERGLPPGPIANPGLAALTAAVQPEFSDYLFYISKPSGETVFSRTLEEHNAAVARWLR